MVDKQETVPQQLISQKNLPFCEVHPTEKVVYQCTIESCPNFEVQKLYCSQCGQGEQHDHKPFSIDLQVNSSEAGWKEFLQKLTQINANVGMINDQYNDVIAVLDQMLTNVIPYQTLADQIELFTALYNDVNKFYENLIIQCITTRDFIKLNEFNPSLSEFEQRFQALEYLRLGAPSIMWRFYSEIVADVQMFTLLEHLNLQSLTLVIQLKLQKSEITLQTITHQQQILPHLAILEDQDFNPTAEITRLLAKLNVIQSSDVRILSQVDQLRNQLDALGVTTSLIQQQSQTSLLKARTLIQLKEQDSEIERMMKQNEEAKQPLPQPQPAVLQQVQAPQDLGPQQQQNLFADSLILNDATKRRTIIGYFTQMGKANIMPSLLYRATRDGFGADDFHRTCDNKGPTLTIILTTTGFIIGGYTSEQWESGVYSKMKRSNDGWLFTIAHPHPFRRLQADERGIWCTWGRGALFGGGDWDIAIGDNSNSNGENWVHGSSSSYEFEGVHLLNGEGQTDFTTKEIEVYQFI
ncbi:hypothetical protein FGO68_gene2768 [Halteria grandinella]|uniref:TLDc domain-containing protein n=1 Tax=Halteria grandinella TaxID=5974 RepID=A0A8J8T2E3_HALGN|nr:hypothetical protein FGO68_gene2768 [Halteria grandinella]